MEGKRGTPVDEAQVVVRTPESPPQRLGVTHWSSRLLGTELGLSNVTVAKEWKKLGHPVVANRDI
jgi:hypothetical protein